MQTVSPISSHPLRFSIRTRLILSFGFVVGSLIGVSFYTIHGMNRLATLTEKLYDHPFTVNTAVLRVENGIVSMHRSMKDVALSTNAAELEAAVLAVNETEDLVLDDFDIILNRYLGDLSTIESARQEFVEWKLIRDRVIQLRKEGEIEAAAAITKGEGAQHIQHLLDDINDIEAFASNKASEFLADAQTSRQQIIRITIAVAAGVTVLTAVIAYWITYPIIQSLKKAVDLNNQLAEGNLDLDIQHNSRDEIGQLLDSMQHMVNRLRQIVKNVKTTSGTMANDSLRVSASANQMSSGVTEQAAATEQASASMQSMVQNIQNNTNHAQETEVISHRSADDAEETRQAMIKAIDVMKTIIQQISVIQEIAQETNMLALNASIEATRYDAGETGFGVVAAEIRNLAQRVRQVAAEIGDMAGSSITTVSQAESMLNKLVPGIQTTAALVQKISVGSSDQLQASSQINQAIGQLEIVTRCNSDLAADLSRMAQGLAHQSDDLKEAIAFFQITT